ncbi:MAG: SDR family NAD(P)-dependent oxidoreductase, partial [Thermoanaerobaculia bacterium]
MKIDLQGKTVLVTGAGRGIGREIALLSAEAGASLVLAARSRAELEEVAAKIASSGGEALVVPVDLREEAAADQLMKAALDRFARVDVLVNNAGSNSIANLVMVKEEDLRAVYELNV